jgi:hypothetical protein
VGALEAFDSAGGIPLPAVVVERWFPAPPGVIVGIARPTWEIIVAKREVA